MLHIIFLILKIIGIILLVLLGIFLFMLLIILFVPIRYQVTAVHGESVRIDGRISWLLHIIHGRVIQDGEDRHIQLRIFGFVIYDNQKPVKPKKVKKKQIKRSKRRKIRVTQVNKKELHDYKEEDNHYDTQDSRGKSAKTFREASHGDMSEDHKISRLSVDHESDRQEAIVIRQKDNSEELISNNKNLHLDTTQKEKQEQDVILEEISPEIVLQEEHEGSGEAESLFEKLWNRIRTIFLRVKDFFGGLIRKIKHVILTLINIKHKVSLVKEFLRDELNQEAIKLSFASIRKLLKHILPTKLRSRVVFGTGDPCSTGQALGVFGILYSFYGDNIQIIPDFENKVFEGSHYAKGRIRLITILIIVIKLIIDKKFKQFMRNFKILKEAL